MTPPDASSYALPRRGAGRPVGSGARPDAKRLIAERLRARRRKVAIIRRRVVALAMVTFLVLWSAIFVQLALGNDPALTRSTAAKTIAAPATTATTSGTGAPKTSSTSAKSSAAGAKATSSSSSAGQATPVTTSQS